MILNQGRIQSLINVNSQNSKGYKTTEIGIIPEDWEIRSLGELFDFSGGYPVSRENLGNEGYSYLHYGDIHLSPRSYINLSKSLAEIPKLDVSLPEVPKGALLNDGDVVFVDASEDVEGASRHHVVINPHNIPFIAGLHTIVAKPKSDALLNGYEKYCFQTDSLKDQFRTYVVGTKVSGISKSNIKKILISIPPTTEQEAIAEALSDVDDLIESLEQLIAKKRLIKQGAIQELLTGKSRLPGFDDEWESLPLQDVCHQIVDGTHFTPQYVESGVPFYSVENVVANDFTNTKFISLAEHQRLSKRCQPKKGDILLTRIGSIGETKFIDWDVNASIYVSLALLRVNELIDPSFLYCYSKTPQFVTDLEDRSLMNATPKKINMNEIGNVHVPVPTLSEQHAIATILLDVEAEISSLETRLGKVRQVKRGMMQQLLTGKIRLVANKSNVIPFKPKALAASAAKGHNQHFNEAVVISVLTAMFGSLEYPLGRKRRTKLTYLLHRYCEGEAEGFLKKAAGPYNPSIRYKGAEGIAIKNKYVNEHRYGQRTGFIAGEKSGYAQPYFEKWYGTDVLDWLEQFHYTRNDDLELLATVDMAIVDLQENGKDANIETVKHLIHSEPEWAPKLDRSIFSDDNIKRAIDWSIRLFGES